MDIYQIWFDLKPDTNENVFAEDLKAFLNRLQQKDRIKSWRVMRCKLGLRPESLQEFLVFIETDNLAQLDAAFRSAAKREGETDTLHYAANRQVQNVKFALYRDWPDVF